MIRQRQGWMASLLIGVVGSLIAAFVWAWFAGSSDSRVRFRLEFERAPVDASPAPVRTEGASPAT